MMRKEYETPSVKMNRFAPAEAFALTQSNPDNDIERDNDVELDWS